jgi:hypothetical protein
VAGHTEASCLSVVIPRTEIPGSGTSDRQISVLALPKGLVSYKVGIEPALNKDVSPPQIANITLAIGVEEMLQYTGVFGCISRERNRTGLMNSRQK